ncbi:hypothetical protein P154DRAFT_521039 [Amniculicola lignicola CBS 123094]|uniref:rRNA-processing protein n=1 Tax=Amniculicola lignicola CBS 123094 TaxID=1392246 RepID=A0A6A5WMU1_9PLEO|nr:hypothetical protein P154DRAFT_521039 [Amniculicola lignicola CBS 123094]
MQLKSSPCAVSLFLSNLSLAIDLIIMGCWPQNFNIPIIPLYQTYYLPSPTPSPAPRDNNMDCRDRMTREKEKYEKLKKRAIEINEKRKAAEKKTKDLIEKSKTDKKRQALIKRTTGQLQQ